jgi:hypothetical protein
MAEIRLGKAARKSRLFRLNSGCFYGKFINFFWLFHGKKAASGVHLYHEIEVKMSIDINV